MHFLLHVQWIFLLLGTLDRISMPFIRTIWNSEITKKNKHKTAKRTLVTLINLIWEPASSNSKFPLRSVFPWMSVNTPHCWFGLQINFTKFLNTQILNPQVEDAEAGIQFLLCTAVCIAVGYLSPSSVLFFSAEFQFDLQYIGTPSPPWRFTNSLIWK